MNSSTLEFEIGEIMSMGMRQRPGKESAHLVKERSAQVDDMLDYSVGLEMSNDAERNENENENEKRNVNVAEEERRRRTRLEKKLAKSRVFEMIDGADAFRLTVND